MRVNSALLTMFIVDTFIHYKGKSGLSQSVTLWKFYCLLADVLIDNHYLCQDSVEEEHVTDDESWNPERKRPVGGIGPHQTLTTRKRKDGVDSNALRQGHCRVRKKG